MTVSKEKLIHCLYQIVRMLADTIAMKEGHSTGNQQNASRFARCIAQVMELDQDMIDGIRIGAMLHDFGILRIPSAILAKPDRLTPQEYEIMKQHPVHGYQMLKTIDFPWDVPRMVLQHSERLDGSGYPGGLSGDDIILEARVIAVADVIDSMTADRPWRKALPIETALEELKNNRGIKYDPTVVDAAVDLFTNKKHLLDPDHYRH